MMLGMCCSLFVVVFVLLLVVCLSFGVLLFAACCLRSAVLCLWFVSCRCSLSVA